MPYTTVVAGTTITASWANANVRDQVVTPFASASARSSAITVPVNGMLTYLADVRRFEAYDSVVTAWVPLPGQIIAHGQRDTSSASSSTTELGVVRFDIPVVNGCMYWLASNSICLASSASGDTIRGTFRYTIDGSVPTITSPILTSTALTQTAFTQEAAPILGKYIATFTGSLRVLLTVARTGGTGSISMIVTGNNPSIDVMAESKGIAPADTGVDI